MKAEEFLGMDITEAAKKLGYWWVLKHQTVPNYGTRAAYSFVRYCLGEVHFSTERNKVVECSFFPAVTCVANNGWDNEKGRLILA